MLRLISFNNEMEVIKKATIILHLKDVQYLQVECKYFANIY